MLWEFDVTQRVSSLSPRVAAGETGRTNTEMLEWLHIAMESVFIFSKAVGAA